MDRFQPNIESMIKKRRGMNPSRGYLWTVQLPDLNEIGDFNSASFTEAKNRWGSRSHDMEALNTLVTEFTAPFFSVETEKVPYGSTFWYRGSHNDISNINITLEENESGDVYEYIMDWLAMKVNPDGSYNPPAFYKKNIKFHRLNYQKRVFQTIEYGGYFPSEMPSQSNTNSSNEMTRYGLTLTGDEIVREQRFGPEETDNAIRKALLDLNIPYDRFRFEGVPDDVVANLLNQMASIAL